MTCRKVGEGQSSAIIYIDFVDLESTMLRAKFPDDRTSDYREEYFDRIFTIYGRGVHLGHLTRTIYLNFRFLFQWRLHKKFGYDLPSDIRE